jgi:hypothetical protein
MNSETLQSHVRKALYWLSGALVSYGLYKPDAFWIEPAIGLLVTAATYAWSRYGERLNGLLIRVQAKDGVEKTIVEVNPNKINPTEVNTGTPNGITAKAA